MQHTEIAKRFVKAADLAGIVVREADIEVQYQPAPHTPPSPLPKGKSAIYVFMLDDRCLKVGKAGPKSAARFCSQHYGANRAPSTLANSVIKANLGAPNTTLTANNVSDWLRANTSRVNFLLPSSHGPGVLALFEVFVQCCLQPEFEGFASQRVVAQQVAAADRQTATRLGTLRASRSGGGVGRSMSFVIRR